MQGGGSPPSLQSPKAPEPKIATTKVPKKEGGIPPSALLEPNPE